MFLRSFCSAQHKPDDFSKKERQRDWCRRRAEYFSLTKEADMTQSGKKAEEEYEGEQEGENMDNLGPVCLCACRFSKLFDPVAL